MGGYGWTQILNWITNLLLESIIESSGSSHRNIGKRDVSASRVMRWLRGSRACQRLFSTTNTDIERELAENTEVRLRSTQAGLMGEFGILLGEDVRLYFPKTYNTHY